MAEKKVKRKINKKGLIVILLTIYLIIMVVYYIFSLPIKTIVINKNKVLKDKEIISVASLEDYPSLFRTSTSSVKNKLKSLELISDVKIKKSLTGKITITIEEEKILYYNKTTGKYVLSNNKETEITEKQLGIPTLINYTPSDIAEDLNKHLSKIDSDIIELISEIEYSPDTKENITIDNQRFILKMNDGNFVYINTPNFDKIKEYKRLYSTVEKKGIFYLDSNRKAVLFSSFDGEKTNLGEDDQNELPE